MSDDIEQIEADAEAARSRVSDLLDELRYRISPGEVVDQVMDFAGADTVNDFVHRLGRQVRDNPLPCLMVGAGMAWLMLAKGNGHATYVASPGVGNEPGVIQREGLIDRMRRRMRQGTEQVSDRVSDTAAGLSGSLHHLSVDASDRIDGAGARLSGSARDLSSTASARLGEASGIVSARVSEAASDLSARAGDTYDAARDGIDHARESIREAAASASQTASALSEQAAERARQAARVASDTGKQAWSSAAQLFAEQPLVLAGVGLAIGASIAAAFPRSETESHLLDELRGKAQKKAEGSGNDTPPQSSSGEDRPHSTQHGAPDSTGHRGEERAPGYQPGTAEPQPGW